MEIDTPTDFGTSRASSPATPATEAPLPDKPPFELAASSLRLRSFLPVKIIQRHEGGIRPFEVTFPCEVLLRPIAGPYGNYVGCDGGERYVFCLTLFEYLLYPGV